MFDAFLAKTTPVPDGPLSHVAQTSTNGTGRPEDVDWSPLLSGICDHVRCPA
jgi:hypothetical protein